MPPNAPPVAGVVSTTDLGPSATPSASYPELTPPEEPLPLLAILPERAKQRRWTVLVRSILSIPLAVVVLFVGLAATVCVILGWFAALVSGRVPNFVRSIVTVYLRLALRLEAYQFLLTDRFPPFSADDVPEYQANLAVPPATKLRRAAVFFRLVLVIPAAIAVRIVGLGVYVVLFFMWFVVLITGWLPKPVHEAAQAFIRYEIRLLGYFNLLVPTYPGELFGDLAPPTPILLPGSDKVGTYVEAPTAVPPPPPPPPTPTPTPQPWKLILSMGAKRLLLVTIALGIAATIGLSVIETAAGNHENLVQVNNQLVSDLDQFSTTAKSCQDVSCLEQADGELSQRLGDFVNAIEAANSAGVSQNLIDQLTTAAQHAQQVTGDLADAGPNPARYRSTVTREHAEQAINDLVNAQHAFVTALNAQRFG